MAVRARPRQDESSHASPKNRSKRKRKESVESERNERNENKDNHENDEIPEEVESMSGFSNEISLMLTTIFLGLIAMNVNGSGRDIVDSTTEFVLPTSEREMKTPGQKFALRLLIFTFWISLIVMTVIFISVN